MAPQSNPVRAWHNVNSCSYADLWLTLAHNGDAHAAAVRCQQVGT